MSDRVLNMPLQLTLDAINFTQEEREPLLKKIELLAQLQIQPCKSFGRCIVKI